MTANESASASATGFTLPQATSESRRARAARRGAWSGPSDAERSAATNPQPSRATSDHIVIVTWLWRSQRCRTRYTADHVNRWARMVSRHCTVPHRLMCLTDDPDGIEIDTLPIPDDLADAAVPNWRASRGYPQCFRRLALWRRDIADYLGSDRIVSMDLDVVIFDSLDPLLQRPEDVVLYRGTSNNRPYNGSMLMLDAGARPHVFEDFTPERAAQASRRFLGSDQAWLAHMLGWDEACWTPLEGARHLGPSITQKLRRRQPLPDMRVLFFTGSMKPWDCTGHPTIAEHYG